MFIKRNRLLVIFLSCIIVVGFAGVGAASTTNGYGREDTTVNLEVKTWTKTDLFWIDAYGRWFDLETQDGAANGYFKTVIPTVHQFS